MFSDTDILLWEMSFDDDLDPMPEVVYNLYDQTQLAAA